jgi:hypothetical protein
MPVRQKEYSERMKQSINHGDSTRMNFFYEQLSRIYYEASATDYDTLQEFSLITGKDISANFEPKIMTFVLLDFLFDSAAAKIQRPSARDSSYYKTFAYSNMIEDVSSSMGHGDFVHNISFRKFHGGFMNDVNYILNEKYFMVLVVLDVEKPDFIEGEDSFTDGYFKGGILIYDITTAKKVAYHMFVTSNDAEVSSIPYKKGRMNKLLLANLFKNVKARINDISISAFGKKWE